MANGVLLFEGLTVGSNLDCGVSIITGGLFVTASGTLMGSSEKMPCS